MAPHTLLMANVQLQIALVTVVDRPQPGRQLHSAGSGSLHLYTGQRSRVATGLLAPAPNTQGMPTPVVCPSTPSGKSVRGAQSAEAARIKTQLSETSRLLGITHPCQLTWPCWWHLLSCLTRQDAFFPAGLCGRLLRIQASALFGTWLQAQGELTPEGGWAPGIRSGFWGKVLKSS